MPYWQPQRIGEAHRGALSLRRSRRRPDSVGPPDLIRRGANGRRPDSVDGRPRELDPREQVSGVEHVARVSSSVIFVRDLDRSIEFYRDVFAYRTTILDLDAALLLSPDGFQLYLIVRGRRTPHPLGGIGLQHLIWAVDSAQSLDRFEQVLKDRGIRYSIRTSGDVKFLTARDPDGIRIMIAYPPPQAHPRSVISAQMYAW